MQADGPRTAAGPWHSTIAYRRILGCVRCAPSTLSSRRVPLIIAAVLAMMGGLVVPSGSDAKAPKVSVSASVTSSGLLTVKGQVRPARTSWKVRVETRKAVLRKNGRRVAKWVRLKDSPRLGSRGLYRVRARIKGTKVTVRTRVIAGRKTVARSRHLSTRTTKKSVAPGPGRPGAGASPAPPVAPPTAPTPPSGLLSPVPGTSPIPGQVPAPPAVAPDRSSLSGGEALRPGQDLVSPSRTYRLTMQNDGNLVLYQGSKSLWSTGTTGNGSHASMQSDGNLVLRSASGAALWATGTEQHHGADLALHDDGNLIVWDGARPVWSRDEGYVGNQLAPGWVLRPGHRLWSPDRRFSVLMQSDGNLGLYEGSVARWYSGNGIPGAHAELDPGTGNFAVWNGGSRRWSAETWSLGASRVVLQNDGNLVVWAGSRPVWTSRDGYRGDTLLPGWELASGQQLRSVNGKWTAWMQPDGNLGVWEGSVARWWSGNGTGGAHAVLHPANGNFAVWNGADMRWSAGTANLNADRVKLEGDGNLVVYAGTKMLWSRTDGLVGGPVGINGPLGISGNVIASRAESRANGTYEGQCLAFVSNMIGEAGGPRWQFGLNEFVYQQKWRDFGAVEVGSIGEARRGDIIQWGGEAGDGNVHTAIITSPGVDPQLIDSNFGSAERVGRGSFSSRNRSFSRYRVWRVGQP